LLAWTPGALGQLELTVSPDGPLTLTEAVTQAVASLSSEIKITLEVDDCDAADPFLQTSGIQINLLQPNKRLTIAGSCLQDPHNVVVTNSGLVTPVFTIMGAGTVIFESLTIKGGRSAGISVTGSLANVVLNRCLVKDSVSGPGLSFNGATCVIANSVFTGSKDAALDVTGGNVVVVQSTFIDGESDAIKVNGGEVQAIACLFYRNAGNALTPNTGGVLTARYCVSEENNNDTAGLIESRIEATVNLATPMRWPGDLATGIPASGLESLPGAAEPYKTYDFEYEPRFAAQVEDDPQVGADHEGGGVTDMVWVDTQYALFSGPTGAGYGDGRLYIGKGAVFEIVIIGNLGADASVLLVPETRQFDPLNLLGGPLDLPLSLDPGSVTDPTAVRVGRATFTLQSTSLGNVVLDGHATVYLRNGPDVYGVRANTDPGSVAPQALLNSRLLVLDTMPPRLQIPADATADRFIIGSSDVFLASSDTGSPFPGDWPPAQSLTPTNGVVLVDATTTLGNAAMYLNGPGPLGFTVVARFEDPPPEGANIVVAGFDGAIAEAASGTAAAGDLLNPSDTVPRPYWVGRFMHTKGIEPDDPVMADFLLAGPGARELDAMWTVSGIPDNRAQANDWNIEWRFAAMDRAGNVSSQSGNSLELWWMPFAPGTKMTSTSTSTASFSWDLDRQGAAPSNASPSDPLFSYRLWSVGGGVGPGSAQWAAVGPWTPWDRLKSVTIPNTILNNDQYKNKRMLITVMGADEAGNVHQAGPLAGNSFSGFSIPESRRIAYEHWLNRGGAAQIDTIVTAHFWHVDDAGDLMRDFGTSTRIPLPSENSGLHVEAQFDIVVETPTLTAPRFVNWELFEDGAQVGVDAIRVPDNEKTVILRLRADAGIVLGDEAQRAHTRTYLFRAVAVFGEGYPPPTLDDTPATISFTVYIPEGGAAEGRAGGPGGDPGDEQPFKIFVRGEE